MIVETVWCARFRWKSHNQGSNCHVLLLLEKGKMLSRMVEPIMESWSISHLDNVANMLHAANLGLSKSRFNRFRAGMKEDKTDLPTLLNLDSPVAKIMGGFFASRVPKFWMASSKTCVRERISSNRRKGGVGMVLLLRESSSLLILVKKSVSVPL
jgi:hypothetical protein